MVFGETAIEVVFRKSNRPRKWPVQYASKIYGLCGQKLSTELSVSMFLFSQAQKMSFALKTQEAKHKDSSKKEIHCSAVVN